MVSNYSWIYQGNCSPLRDVMDVFNYRETFLIQQGKVTYIVVFIYTLKVMYLWQYDTGNCMSRRWPWNLEEGSSWIYLGGIGNPWGSSPGVCWESCAFVFFVICLCFICDFVYVWCKDLPLYLINTKHNHHNQNHRSHVTIINHNHKSHA